MKVIYVMGYARSGSTLLDIVLGAHPSVFGAGELCNLIPAMDIRHEYCACGVRSAECPFWVGVRRAWASTIYDIGKTDYERLRSHFERLRSYPRYWKSHQRDDSLINKHLVQTSMLFEAIGKVSGVATIVESSKAPLRTLALSRMKNIELRVIHLVRDPRGVAFSLAQAYEPDPSNGIVAALPAQRPTVTVLNWMLFNALADRVRARLGRRAILVRYEDLITDPIAVFERMSSWVNIDFSGVAKRLRNGDAFRPTHTIAGNRLRMSGPIRLRTDVKWRLAFSAARKRWLGTLSFPVAGRYGYRL